MVSEDCVTTATMSFWVAWTETRGYGVIWPKLLPRDMPEFVTLHPLGFELLYMTPITTKGCGDIQGLFIHLWPCWCLRVMLPPRPGWSGWPALPTGAIVICMPGLLLETMPGSVVLPQCWCLWPVLTPKVIGIPQFWTNICDHAGIWGSYLLVPCWSGLPVLQPGPWWHLGPNCSWGPYLDPWSWCSWVCVVLHVAWYFSGHRIHACWKGHVDLELPFVSSGKNVFILKRDGSTLYQGSH